MSDDKEFDGKKYSDDLHDQIHRDVHARLRAGIGILGKDGVRPLPMHWGLFSGGIIALIGLLILLDNMGFHALNYLYRFWPMILILIGVWNLACKSGRVFGGVLVILGVLFQLDALGIAHFTWGEMWPMAIIGAGILVMWSSLQARKLSTFVGKTVGESEADLRTTLNEVAIFGGVERRITSPDFRGGFVHAVFGGVELDLRDAKMQVDEATLEINAVFGGVEIRVPDDWQVVSRGQAIFGGFVDETKNYRPEPAGDAKRKALILTGAAVFGGVEIKN
jgi:predicted membrane protein